MQTKFAAMNGVQRDILSYMNKHGIAGVDPRWIEGYMRVQYGTLSHLDRRTFNKEIRIGVACVREGGADEAEKCAKSWGL